MLRCCIGLDLDERSLLPIQQPALTVGLLLMSGVIRLLLPYLKPFRSTPDMAEQPTTRWAESARLRYRRKQPRPYGTSNFCASFCASKMMFSFFGIKKATLASRQKTCRLLVLFLKWSQAAGRGRTAEAATV